MISLTHNRQILASLLAMTLIVGTAQGAVDIQTAPNGSPLEELAAKEVTRYLYLRTGVLPAKLAEQGTIVVVNKDSSAVTDASVRTAARDLESQQFVLKTTIVGGKKTWWIVGGDDVGTLYGAYRIAEKLGVRFYLHGDVIPDQRLAKIPDIDETGKPLFGLRGVNPWGSHPFGFDAWGTDDYKAIFTQLAKMAAASSTGAMTCLVDLLPTLIDAAGGKAPTDIDGRSFLPVLTQPDAEHRKVVFGSHTGNENGGPGIANHCPARTVRTPTHRYILNLSPQTTFTTQITGCKSGAHYLPHWDSWVEKAKTDAGAKSIVQRYQHRPKEELYNLESDPFEMNNLAADPKQAELLKSLRTQLAAWCKTQGDTLPLKHLTE
jgi:hypothetical protein